MNKITSHLDKKLAEIQNRANMAPTWSILAVDIELLLAIVKRQNEALTEIAYGNFFAGEYVGKKVQGTSEEGIAKIAISDIEKLINQTEEK